MSQGWKQTKLDMGAWKIRPRGGDDQEPTGDGMKADVLVPLKRSLESPSLTAPTKRKPPESSSPLSDATSSAPSPESNPKSPPSITTFNVPTFREPHLPSPPSILHNAAPKTASLSFTSSQLPPSSSSQRIVRNGERMVTNSDDDDDSSSLEDLDDVLRLQKPSVPERLPPSVKKSQIGSKNIRRDFNYGRTVLNMSNVPKMPNYKYSLAVLAEQQKQLQKSEVDMAKVNATLEGRRKALPTNGEAVDVKGLPNESMLDAVMSHTGDEEDASRLKDALRRTEALHQDPAWSFFHSDAHTDRGTPPEFPNLDEHPLRHILGDTSSRQQAFLNGYVEDYAMKNGIPDELLEWILESTCSEAREDLKLSYIQVLSEVGSGRDLLSPQFIDRSFRCIGACDEALDVEMPITPSFMVEEDTEEMIRDRIPFTLALIKNLSSTLNPESRKYAICILCRLLLDHQVVYDCNVMTALDETLNTLIESIPENSFESDLYEALVKVFGSVADSKLRLQMVSYLPVYDSRTAIFRRRLALAFFYEDAKFLKIASAEKIIDLDSIAAYLQTPRFKIGRDTNYAELTSSLTMLDIGIDGGDPPLPFTSKKDERRFDDAVDRLAKSLKDISSKIVGTSNLDMRKTDAKEILHAMQRRLTYAVRSEPYIKKSFLAQSEANYDSEKKGMSEYLDSNKAGVADHPLLDATGESANREQMYIS